MPTVLFVGPYRFFFYSSDQGEPPHVHVERENNVAKFWLAPVRVQSSSGFRPAELRRLQSIVTDNEQLVLRKWHEYFDA